MVRQRNQKAFGQRPASAPSPPGNGRGESRRTTTKARSQGIPDAVAGRMARRIALATGLPSLAGMAVFVGSYLLVSRGLLDIPPAVTLVASGACFILGLLGLSYGVLSASWEEAPGSLFGTEQIALNIGRLRQSVQQMRSGG